MENKIITVFESNMSLIDFCEANDIDLKYMKITLEYYIELFMSSKINVKKQGLDLLKDILREFESGKKIRKIAFEYDLLDEDVAKIIHVMLFNKYKYDLRYNFISIPAKNEPNFVLKCRQIGINLDNYIKIEEHKKRNKDNYVNNYKNFNKKETDTSYDQQIIDMYNNYYTIYKIAEVLNKKVRYVINVLNNYFKDSNELEINRIMPIEYTTKLLEEGFTIEKIEFEYGVPRKYLNILLNIEKEFEFNYEDYDKSKLEDNIITLYLTGMYKSFEIANMLETTDTHVSIVISNKLKGKYLSNPKAVSEILKNNGSLEVLTKYADDNHVILTDYSIIEGYKLANKITLKK